MANKVTKIEDASKKALKRKTNSEKTPQMTTPSKEDQMLNILGGLYAMTVMRNIETDGEKRVRVDAQERERGLFSAKFTYQIRENDTIELVLGDKQLLLDSTTLFSLVEEEKAKRDNSKEKGENNESE